MACATGVGTRSGRPLDARRLRQEARSHVRSVAPEVGRRHEAGLLRREERPPGGDLPDAHDDGNGTFSGRFVVPELHGVALRPRSSGSPRPVAPSRRDGQPRPLEVVHRHGNVNGGAAFCEIVEHLPARRVRPQRGQVLVHVGPRPPPRRVGARPDSTPGRVSAGEARRLVLRGRASCRSVLGGGSAVLDLGRTRRLHVGAPAPGAVGGATTPARSSGCERPFAWCEVHHPHAWSHGGATDLANALPLCGHHHRRGPRRPVRPAPSTPAATGGFHRRR